MPARREQNRTVSHPRWDPLAVVAVAIVLVVVVVYLGIMREQGDTPVPWFLAALLLGAGAAGYGADRARPHRGAALVLAAGVLAAVGVLAILSIGFPVLAAGAVCLLAAVKSVRSRSAAPS